MPLGLWTMELLSSALLKVMWYLFEMILVMLLGWNHTVPYLGRSPTWLIWEIPALQWIFIVALVAWMFLRRLQFMKTTTVEWLSSRIHEVRMPTLDFLFQCCNNWHFHQHHAVGGITSLAMHLVGHQSCHHLIWPWAFELQLLQWPQQQHVHERTWQQVSGNHQPCVQFPCNSDM